jgi:DNA mismatch repair protein MutL
LGDIVLLDDLTINQIAAGEVLDRPANAVKELVENSIDAGAKHIIVEIKKGGKSFIRVTDDGKGIKPDDILISLERHATSKIRTVEDLENSYTMGFRGEALASIVSVSYLTMVTRTKDEETAIKIVAKGRRNFRITRSIKLSRNFNNC